MMTMRRRLLFLTLIALLLLSMFFAVSCKKSDSGDSGLDTDDNSGVGNNDSDNTDDGTPDNGDGTEDNNQPCEHNYTTVTYAPTCEIGGYDEKTCTLCGDTVRENETEPTGHTFVDGECTACGKEDGTGKPGNDDYTGEWDPEM
jgi:hypothetical protein